MDIAWRISGEFYVPLVEPRSFCIAFDFSGFWRIIIPFVAQGATLLSRYIRQNFIVLLRLHRAPNVPLHFFSRRSGLLYAIFDKTPKNSMIVGYRLVDTFVQWQTFCRCQHLLWASIHYQSRVFMPFRGIVLTFLIGGFFHPDLHGLSSGGYPSSS